VARLSNVLTMLPAVVAPEEDDGLVGPRQTRDPVVVLDGPFADRVKDSRYHRHQLILEDLTAIDAFLDALDDGEPTRRPSVLAG